MTHRTNRWTGATGSEFRIKRDPAKLLASAVARSTQPLGCFSMNVKLNSFIWPAVVASVTFCAAFVFMTRFGPLDTLPRVQTARCSDNVSIMFRKQKVGWFSPRTGLSVQMVDRRGALIREFGVWGADWNERWLPQTAQPYCDEQNWLEDVARSR